MANREQFFKLRRGYTINNHWVHSQDDPFPSLGHNITITKRVTKAITSTSTLILVSALSYILPLIPFYDQQNEPRFVDIATRTRSTGGSLRVTPRSETRLLLNIDHDLETFFLHNQAIELGSSILDVILADLSDVLEKPKATPEIHFGPFSDRSLNPHCAK